MAARKSTTSHSLEQRVRMIENMVRKLRQHRRHHHQLRQRVRFGPDTLLGHLEALAEDTEDIQRKVEAEGDYRMVLACVRERTGIVELVAKLRGELDSRVQHNVVNFNLDADAVQKMLETYVSRRKALEGKQ